VGYRPIAHQGFPVAREIVMDAYAGDFSVDLKATAVT
jgi:hypothetical protein